MNDIAPNQQFFFDEDGFRSALKDSTINNWIDPLIEAVKNRQLHHGDLPRWQAALDALPELPITNIDHNHETGVAALTDQDIAEPSDSSAAIEPTPYPLSDDAQALEPALKRLSPWRKGPFRIAHVTIDTEWRSDWKWNRVSPHIADLTDRVVLDVGCGNGYHMWRMRAAGAKTVIGIDPGQLFSMQFRAIQHYIQDTSVHLLPLTMETLPENMRAFDTVFSMGVLYHRKDPQSHLNELLQAMQPGAELVLETLVTLGEEETTLNLDGRYARMRNIWQLPSVPMLGRWMKQSGFTNVRFVSLDTTSRLEQRTTHWMPYESLTESLDPNDLSLTVEGLPRPRRAIMLANAPST